MRYVYLRIFLTTIEQPALLVMSGDLEERVSREEYLKKIFSMRWEFPHFGTLMTYIPISTEQHINGTFCFGRVGKQVTDKVNASPEELFEPKQAPSWRTSNVLLDTRHHDDGQKIVVQDRGEVGKPLAVLSSLVNSINIINSDSGWFASVNPIIEKSDFWEATERYQGQITRAEFTYVTPNVLGIRSKLNERLKEYREKENAQEVTVVLSEPKGQLKFDTDEVRDAVDYISEGGGSAKLKVGRDTVFDSQDNAKARAGEVDDSVAIEDQAGRTNLVLRLFDWRL